ncbi:Bug family tripartite tricarboxylate transporter substrate binding protein [Falsiroseomonas oryzae]|uniref:Bug family tripartite tricarboxylate transporter substrate binding protein n=1 Tax=Falsiroseomonas oryzae TaxID=2766473 RepID=UPI0022EABB79|nr:tripartite tricarboxylate transporter substrate binding protein [Roseomonas sp. MO-31]
MRRRTLIAAVAATLPAPALRAQGNWPDRPIRFIVPFAPGGTTDIMARVLAPRMTTGLGVSVVVENRAGAGGTVGHEIVVRAAPDGNTIMLGHIGTLGVNPSLYPRLAFDPIGGVAPVSMVALVPNILAVHPRVPANTLQDLLALARQRPGQLTYGSAGNGSAAHIAAAALGHAAGVEWTHVPYRGSGPMVNDLVAGQIDFTMTGGTVVMPLVRDGRLRALGVSSAQRMRAAPEIPTIAEQGVPGFETTQWYCVVTTAGVPAPIVARLNAEVHRAMSDPELQARLALEGAEAAPGTPEELGATIRAEAARWADVVRRTGMRAD